MTKMIRYVTKGHPSADGRKPQGGDLHFDAHIELEGEKTLSLWLGVRDVVLLHKVLSKQIAMTMDSHPGAVLEAVNTIDIEEASRG